MSTPVLPDLITLAYLQSVYDAAGLTAAEQAALPALITAASRAVRGYCKRRFTRATVDELYTPPRRGMPLVLREFPVNGVVALMGNPTPVLTVWNASAAAQRATAALATTGSVGTFNLAATGLTLASWSSGVPGGASVPFSANPTVQAVAQAIGALGGGWAAAADPAHALRASADFRPPQGAFGCLGASGAAGFAIHADDLPFGLDAAAGLVDLDDPADDDPFASPRWGVYLATDWGDTTLRGVPGGLRCIYDCGFDTIPEDVQYWTAAAAKGLVERMRTDSTLAGETAGAYRWDARALVEALPSEVKQGLGPWRNPRA